MRATLLGHASFLIEGGGATVLMDPVFQDPFERDAVSCPARVVHRSALPPIDAVFLSHSHLDHFDLPSLCTLPRGVPVYIPPDEELHRLLREAGFRRIGVVRARERVQAQGLTVIPTASTSEFEHGFFATDGVGSLWNHVDSVVLQRAARAVSEDAGGKLDVAVCGYNPLIEYGETWVSESEFPRERYERLLEAALMSRAGTVVPGSAGQRIAGPRAWVNHRVFPVTREQFLRDLRDVAPEQHTLLLNPGEALVIDGTRPVFLEKTPYADLLRDDTSEVDFAPHEHPPQPLRDANVHGYDEALLERFVTELIERQLVERMRALLTPRLLGPLRTLWDRRAALQIDVVFPSDKLAHWHLARWHPQVAWSAGAHPRADYVFTYVASELLAFTRGHSEELPQTQARRVLRERAAGEPYRLMPLDPARLHGVDLYNTVDETYFWTPLIVLTDLGDKVR